MWCLSALSIAFVIILFAVCTFVIGCVFDMMSSISFVYSVQLALR